MFVNPFLLTGLAAKAPPINASNGWATLGDALKQLSKAHSVHPALKAGLLNLYGYTNDSGGIRHAMTDGDEPTFAEAKFMVITCSAFVNYISQVGLAPTA